MVIHGEKPSTAGASVGYVDLYHFSKVFKQHFGMSPRAYVLKCTLNSEG
ncbi:MAG: AraC family transcriptional regulator [Firmicutes bacterium]|nr:AraC family transcriptional regulator [Bacillota bacterium]